jgi:hypothetical protein
LALLYLEVLGYREPAKLRGVARIEITAADLRRRRQTSVRFGDLAEDGICLLKDGHESSEVAVERLLGADL